MTDTSTQKLESVDLQQLAIWTAVAAIVAAVINAIIYLIMQSQFVGVFMQGNAFNIVPVIAASIIGIAAGGILLAILDRFLKRPITVWMWVAIVVLLISLSFPFGPALEGDVTLTMQLTLLAMHLVAGGITIYLLTTRTKKSA